MTYQSPGGRWPDPRQELLLEAAVSAPRAAAAAWREWDSRYTLDDLHDDANNVLPAVYRALRHEVPEVPQLPRIKGIYRRAWYHNQLLIGAGLEMIRALQDANIPVLLMKGVPLLFHWYGDSGVRPLGDVDLLIRPEDGERAVALFRERGWEPLVPIREPLETTLEMVHAIEFRLGAHGNIDLHPHALEECLYKGADDGFWSRAQPLSLPGLETQRLSATDMLLHVCVHGSRGAPGRVVHWIPDALAILRGGEAIDWEILYREARSRRLIVPVREALAYLAERFEAPVPPRVLARFDRVRPSLLERADYYVQARAPGAGWMAARDLMRYSRVSSHWRLDQRVTRAPVFFASMWGKDSIRDVPGEAWRRVQSRRKAT